ncbi:MAG: DUF177 domain-containing protein [Bacteroidia bacterium]|nr:DUF177 domain-containing protein [Bacteroidia bacterium]
MKEFIIPFIGLKTGEHVFDYKIGTSFLKNFNNSEIKDIELNVEVKMIKNNNLLEFNFQLNGSVQVECDICLDDVSLPVDYHSYLIAKRENVEDAEDDIVYLKPDESEIDISQFIYECIVFSLPLRRVHPDKRGKNKCNPEMIKKLKSHLVDNVEETSDPRWNDLKNLLNN